MMGTLYTALLPYMQVYLSVGVLTLFIAAHSPLRAWLRQRREPESLLSLLESMDPRSSTLGYRIRARVLVPLLAGLALVLLWPAVPCLKLRGWLQDREMARFAEAQVFKVQRGHLLERLTIEEIEAREWVKDPLNSVPGHPFGHLYAVWCALRVKVRPRDELWSFKAQWHDGWGRPDSRAGYVVWRRGESAGHILTVLKRLEESSGACQSSASASGNPAMSADELELPDFLRRQAD